MSTTTTRLRRTTTMKLKPHSLHSSAVTLSSSSKKRCYADICDSVMLEDRNNNKTTTTPKMMNDTKDDNDDDSPRVLIQPDEERIIKLVAVEVKRLGGLKFRFRFSSGNIHHRKSSGDDAAAGVMNNLAVRKTTKQNCPASSAAARVKKLGLRETAEPDHCWRLWRQIKLEREREAARRKIESMTKTVDISNNYYEVMGKLDRMFGDREWVMEAFYGARNEKPLEKLGLFLKE